MDMQATLKHLQAAHIIESHLTEYRALSGGTSSTVIGVFDKGDPLYVVKWNERETIKAESHFLNTYANIDLLPRLLYVEPSYRYMVYGYRPGSVQYECGSKRALLMLLAERMMNRYVSCAEVQGYGFLSEPVRTWQEFLLSRAAWAERVIAHHLSVRDHEQVRTWIHCTDSGKAKYLLHGDCGVHNFLFDNGELSGVIDPTPVAGEPLYDLIYAFCSSPDELNESVLRSATDLLDHQFVNHLDIQQEVWIGLYFRIAACLVHHPHDLQAYLKAWRAWK